jgi:hypothetical protein
MILSPELIAEAKQVAAARNSTNRGANNPDGAIINSGRADFLGALGELVVASTLGLAWTGRHFGYAEWMEYRRSGADVGDFEVKCTDHTFGRLWIRSGSPVHLDRKYILVKVDLPRSTGTIAGWAYGKEIAKPVYLEFGKYNKPAYYLPSRYLRGVSDM